MLPKRIVFGNNHDNVPVPILDLTCPFPYGNVKK